MNESGGEPLGSEVPAGARSLLLQAENSLHDARRSEKPADRYVAAHLSALRAATAVVVMRSRRASAQRPVSVWRLLAEAAPELRWWAELFAAGTERRAMAESGIDAVSVGDAEALVQGVAEFVRVVRRSLNGVKR